ncbi:MAG: endonuclease III [Alphaproteobacteria bacterium]|nr:endonuclease III [Alphaproteobacteria bacterium]
MKKQHIEQIFSTFSQANPNPKSELEYHNPYTLLVAVTLSAQATDIGVNRATRGLFAVVSTPQDMLDLGFEELIAHIRTIGLFNTKAKNVMSTAQILVEQHGGTVPQTRAELEALPGVGRKTANVVLNIAFAQPTMAVDTHIFRLSNRTGLAPGKTPFAVEKDLVAVIPEAYQIHAHHWLILHGRYVCKARKPDCANCAIRECCAYPDKTQ